MISTPALTESPKVTPSAIAIGQSTTDQAQALRNVFVEQVPNLAIRNTNEYFIDIPRDYVMAESDPLDNDRAFDYEAPFNRSKGSAPDFKNRIQAKLTSTGSTLTPEQIVLRAETQNCFGCHFVTGDVGEGVTFPRSLDGIQHVTGDNPETADGGPRYRISAAMRDTFIPHRMQILIDFLNSGKAPVRSQ